MFERTFLCCTKVNNNTNIIFTQKADTKLRSGYFTSLFLQKINFLTLCVVSHGKTLENVQQPLFQHYVRKLPFTRWQSPVGWCKYYWCSRYAPHTSKTWQTARKQPAQSNGWHNTTVGDNQLLNSFLLFTEGKIKHIENILSLQKGRLRHEP